MTKKRIQVAVVDDDPGYLRALERLLRAAGFTPRGYSSAEAFLQELPRPPIDCAILDIWLGTMTGFDIARRLAAEGSRVPVILMTAHDEPGAREQAREVGGAAYLRKPFSAQLLFEAIQQATVSNSQSEVSFVPTSDSLTEGKKRKQI
jgi:FixJ family two-component response regulator